MYFFSSTIVVTDSPCRVESTKNDVFFSSLSLTCSSVQLNISQKRFVGEGEKLPSSSHWWCQFGVLPSWQSPVNVTFDIFFRFAQLENCVFITLFLPTFFVSRILRDLHRLVFDLASEPKVGQRGTWLVFDLSVLLPASNRPDNWLSYIIF